MPEEKVCDGIGDGKSRSAFEPEEFAGGIEFEKDVPVIGCKNDVDGPVVQREVIHEAQDFFFDLMGELVRPPNSQREQAGTKFWKRDHIFRRNQSLNCPQN